MEGVGLVLQGPVLHTILYIPVVAEKGAPALSRFILVGQSPSKLRWY